VDHGRLFELNGRRQAVDVETLRARPTDASAAAEQTIQQIKPIDTAVEKPRENAQEGSNTAERPAENASEPASNNLTAGAKPDQAQTNESEPKAPAVGAINAKAFEIQNDINDDSKNARLTRIENEIKKKEKEINKLEKLIKEGKSKRGELESQISAQRNSFDEQKRKYDDLTNEVRKLKEEFRVQKSRTKNLGRKREEKPEQNDNSGDAGEPK